MNEYNLQLEVVSLISKVHILGQNETSRKSLFPQMMYISYVHHVVVKGYSLPCSNSF